MNNHHMQEQQQMGSGLTRYRSAPSSCFASLLEGGDGFGSDDFERLFNPQAISPETQRIFSRFMNSGDAIPQPHLNSQFLAPTKIEPSETPDYSMLHNNDNNNPASASASASASGDNRESNRVAQNKIQRIGNSGLIRHSSSPAGLFANIEIDEFGTVRAMGNLGGGGNIANTEASFCSTSRFKSQMSSKMMDPITEIETKASWDDNNDFPNNSWDDNDQVLENRPTTRLSHHLSLPKSFGELSSMEKLLQDSVPCKIRAKRGCATHPRSIAERDASLFQVRRTKISERMRKLQELVPNMEKQTNTSDMLDLAVEYIKDLQGQLKTLSDDREKCSCEAKLGSYTNPSVPSPRDDDG